MPSAYANDQGYTAHRTGDDRTKAKKRKKALSGQYGRAGALVGLGGRGTGDGSLGGGNSYSDSWNINWGSSGAQSRPV